MKKKVRYTYRKGRTFLAAAAMTAALLGGQVYPVLGSGQETETTAKTGILPENVTIESPTALSEIVLPKNTYGTLAWADGSFVPDSRVQSCKVILTPSEDKIAELSALPGWDAQKKVFTGYVTVVVTGLEDEESSEDYTEEDASDYEDTQDVSDEGQTEEEDIEEPTEDDVKDSDEDPDTEEEIDVTEDEDVVEDPEADAQTDEDAEAEEELEEEPVSEDESDTFEEDSNIFDTPEVFMTPDIQSEEPAVDDTEYTEEEQELLGSENHSNGGITVSGIDLPWYVQFRVSSGESYEFVNEKEATIFQSFEFELWNLKTDSKYEIPDGEYVSVTIPVKEGYDYTIEHLLDNGARETIVPSVEGSTMVFSTHSFSPFGIAGSKPIVGEDIADDVYSDKNLTPTPTVVPSGTPGASQTPEPGVTTVPVEPGQGGTGSAAIGKTTGGTGTAEITTHTGSTANTVNSGNTGASDITGSQGSTAAQTSEQKNGAASTNVSGADSQQKTTADPVQNLKEGIKEAVKTGDRTVILPFIILFAAAVIVIIVVVVLKRKK